jgi:hypothetical protein
MRRPAAFLPAEERRLAVELLVGASIALALLARVRGLQGLGMAGVAALVAASLLLSVQAPIGTVPLGYALVIALAGLLKPDVYFPVAALGVLATVPALLRRYDRIDTGRRVLRWAAAAFLAGGAAAVGRLGIPGTSPKGTLLHVGIAGVVFLGADLVTRNWRPPGAQRITIRAAAPVYLSLLCAAGLIAVAYRKDGVGLALVAILPLVLTRFAFDRYAAAREAYQQTIKALSIVPEVAGVTPLGHGERSAVYAVALCRKLGLSEESVERVATAARLHHIGYVTVDDPHEASHGGDRRMLAGLGADILRQTRFLAGVGDLVESVHSDDARFRTLESAALRAASTFDHLVLDDAERTQGALVLLAARTEDAYGAAAALGMRLIVEEDPRLVARAIASGAPLTDAADGSVVARG